MVGVFQCWQACLPHALPRLDENLVCRVNTDHAQARELQIQDHVKGERHGCRKNQYGEPVSLQGGAGDQRRADQAQAGKQ